MGVIWVLVVLMGCATGPLGEARNEFYKGDVQQAAKTLGQARGVPGRDRLLLFMERGLVLHRLGRYEESIGALLHASSLMEQQEVISVGRQTGSLITSEKITEYKGEYSERLWVHTYLMMDYLLLYRYEDALVEAKQALNIFKKHSKALVGDYFTRAIIALCYENLAEPNDAYIEYKKLAGLMPDPSPVASDLYRLSLRLGFMEEAEYYKRYIPKERLPLPSGDQSSELVLFVALGRSPVKVPGNIVVPPSIRFSFPKYKDRSTGYANMTVLDSAIHIPAISISTNINKVARKSLRNRAARLIAKETARAATKEAIAESVERRHHFALGALLRLAFFIMEEPDTRCWQTLPSSLTLLRLQLEPGRHNIRLVIGGRGREAYKDITLPELDALPGQRVYYSIRRPL